MSSRVSKAWGKPVYFWMVGALVASFFLFSFDSANFSRSETSFFDRVFKSLRIPALNLGIDLQGGVRLVYSVDIDKAIENRLAEHGKRIDAVAKKQKNNQSQFLKISHLRVLSIALRLQMTHSYLR